MATSTGNLPAQFLRQLPYAAQVDLPHLAPGLQQEFYRLYLAKQKSVLLAYGLWVFFGLHYAYVNKWGIQFLFWITAGGLGVWWFIDLFRIPKMVRRYNHAQAMQVLATLRRPPHL
ncbi:TM2 domain-containing protein [Rufibacter psychrotolerans]|uniref:TM2 domain-containing protein n=1 Tax=Rufibacter psychrotolerans TaxID=2812556 RepID=UPI001968A0C8|nr:TM2 domain-containing protein [Rufibacter sp. SYSU D00308]